MFKYKTNMDRLHFSRQNYITQNRIIQLEKENGFALAFGIVYMLTEYMTFSVANVISFNKMNMPSLELTPTRAIISIIGLGVSIYINYLKVKVSSLTSSI